MFSENLILVIGVMAAIFGVVVCFAIYLDRKSKSDYAALWAIPFAILLYSLVHLIAQNI